MFLSPVVVDKFINFIDIINNKDDKLVTSRTKLPCTYCNVKQSTTWRPGPCGPSTLCNKCGVAYMDSGRRNRTIELIMKGKNAIWCKRDTASWSWKEDHAAPNNDPRVLQWIRHETSKKRLSTEFTPPTAKRLRV